MLLLFDCDRYCRYFDIRFPNKSIGIIELDGLKKDNMHMEQFRPERQKKPQEKLKNLISVFAEDINNRVEKEYGIADIVDARGAIRMEGFSGAGGFSEERIKSDFEEVREREIEWSGAREERVREFYKTQYGAETEEEIVRIYKENKEKEKNGQMEMFVSALFHKMLKDDFVVVRASAYDDYTNGIDTVMVNVKTGDVVCAFDEVHDHKASARMEEKEEKIKKKALRGGSTLAYGIGMEEGKLVRKAAEHLPVFFLSLSTKDLEDALAGMNYGAEVSEKEREVFGMFLSSLKNQQEMLLGERVSPAVRENLIRFENSIKTMESRASV